jgi:hypothetical protein
MTYPQFQMQSRFFAFHQLPVEEWLKRLANQFLATEIDNGLTMLLRQLHNISWTRARLCHPF